MRSPHLSVFVLVTLAGCTADLGESQSSIVAGTCEPGWETPVLLVDGTEREVASMSAMTSDDGVAIAIDAAAGWEIGDTYVGIGPDASALVWYAVNPEPWATGYLPNVTANVSLADAGIACGGSYKIIVQTYVRPIGTWDRQLASALGSGSLGEWGFFDIRTVCCAPVASGCTYTQGFWKNHEDAWPLGALTLGGQRYSAAELITILRTPVRGDASIALAHQLIAAELNAAQGASLVPAILEAQAWMAAEGAGRRLPYRTSSGSAAAAAASALVDQLAAYNEGLTGPGHCGD